VTEFAAGLARCGVEILSTGGTAKALRDAGLEVVDVSEYTGQKEIMDGRVKTLHPKIYAGLLARRSDPSHVEVLETEGIPQIDLVCVNLYPFEQTIAKEDVTPRDAIENIDIGGPTMIRAAAKNHEDVVVAVKPECYVAILAEMMARSALRPATGWQMKLSPRSPVTTRQSPSGSPSPTSPSRNTGCSPSRSSSTSPTARTRTNGRPSIRRSASTVTC